MWRMTSRRLNVARCAVSPFGASSRRYRESVLMLSRDGACRSVRSQSPSSAAGSSPNRAARSIQPSLSTGYGTVVSLAERVA